MASIDSYTFTIPKEKLEQLKQKLSLSTFPDELDEASWDYGSPLSDIKRLAKYWQENFDFKMLESEINELPNFSTPINIDRFGSLNIHFVHQKSDVKNAIPLLFVHGWPGSFLEVSKLLPLLTRGRKDSPAFHLVAPSLPNFGFSSVVRKKGFSLPQYGEACHKLMQELGYTKYVTQGGDWGSLITRVMGALYPDHVLASHLNMVLANQPPKWNSNPLLALQHALTPYTSREQHGLARTQWFLTKGNGYRTQQSTKPQTLGYALADSPVGLLAWIYEKLHDWTDSYPWTDDEILTWVSIYWFSTAGPAASLRIYFEEMQAGIESFTGYNTRAKLGLAYFPRDLIVIPKIWGRAIGPVIYESDQDSGGHFATWEKPEAIAKDLKSMFRKGGPVYGLVPGLDGYQEKPARK